MENLPTSFHRVDVLSTVPRRRTGGMRHFLVDDRTRACLAQALEWNLITVNEYNTLCPQPVVSNVVPLAPATTLPAAVGAGD